MNTYLIEIELDCIALKIQAKNVTEAREKALKRLDRRKLRNLVKKSYPDNKKCIWIDKI